MHLSTFAARQIGAGWVVDSASKTDGQVKQLVGV
jgi:hypothetical protein